MNKIILSLSLIASISFTACKEKVEEKKEIVTLPVTNPILMDTTITKEYVAEIQSLQNIEVRAKVKGFLETLNLDEEMPNQVKQGIPSQLLRNRPDIRRAELELLATKWEVKVAQLEFYPLLGISSTFGLQAFRPSYLYRLPESIAYSLVSEMAGPIINKNAIMAEFKTANAVQIQA